MRDKARWYLEHGVTVVWLVFPNTREVLVLSATGETRLALGQTLPANERLPDLQPTVAQLFTQLNR